MRVLLARLVACMPAESAVSSCSA